ncbi:MAG: galactokinase [Acidobacteriota bacterium]|nr:MAG: galactokinase [Acidobacteriota bacterium]
MFETELSRSFEREYGSSPLLIASAPGRVNLIGEHTDYNDGFVFPAAIDRRISIAVSRRSDKRVRAFSLDFSQRDEFSLDRIERSEAVGWSNYIRGVIVQFQKAGLEVPGMDLVMSGDVPIGSGLSSSAALEVAMSETIRALTGIELDKVRMALMSQAAEREFVGVQCGIMDQFVSTLAEEGTALFVDCRDLSFRNIALPAGIKVVVCDSKVQRRLEASEYNRRRSECESAARKLNDELGGIRALRDVTLEQLESHGRMLTDAEFRRARHVVGENERVLAMVEALEEGNSVCIGKLLYRSHESLRDDYEVSCRELDTLVELARNVSSTVGARMTGAGFGGCTVNLVEADGTEEFCAKVGVGYERESGIRGEIYVCEPSAGVSSVRP